MVSISRGSILFPAPAKVRLMCPVSAFSSPPQAGKTGIVLRIVPCRSGDGSVGTLALVLGAGLYTAAAFALAAGFSVEFRNSRSTLVGSALLKNLNGSPS